MVLFLNNKNRIYLTLKKEPGAHGFFCVLILIVLKTEFDVESSADSEPVFSF